MHFSYSLEYTDTMSTTVALAKCSDYDFDKVYAAVEEMMSLVPPPDVQGKTVLIKPNILSPKKPEYAICTHPAVVAAAVKAFVKRGAKVIVGESPATANSTAAAKATGMYNLIKENGGEWVDFSEATQITCEECKICKTFDFAKPFTQADVVVTVAKLKTHQFMSYTGTLKNLFGLIIGLNKAKTHYRFQNKQDFSAFITDLNIAANPQYAIMDAIVGMEGKGGPGNGDPVQLGFLAASDNTLAVDWACASIVGYDPAQVPILKEAMSRKKWLSSPDEITYAGCSPDQVKPASFKIVKEAAASVTLQKMLPSALNNLAALVFVKTPHFNKKKCIRCGKCAEICPAHILRFSTKNAEVAPEGTPNAEKFITMEDRKKCLHCFCCHEICPVEAISLHKF